jgi:hypothetical protein
VRTRGCISFYFLSGGGGGALISDVGRRYSDVNHSTREKNITLVEIYRQQSRIRNGGSRRYVTKSKIVFTAGRFE